MNIAPVRGYSNINFRSEENVQTMNNQPNKRTRINPAKTTGWVAIGALATAGAAGFAHQPKLHIASALVSMFAAAAHVGIVSAHHSQHPHKEFNA